MQIEITQEVIEQSQDALANRCLRSKCCPIGIAVRNLYRDSIENLSVSPRKISIQFKDNDTLKIMALPQVAQDFIHSFDNGEAIEPFTFNLPDTFEELPNDNR